MVHTGQCPTNLATPARPKTYILNHSAPHPFPSSGDPQKLSSLRTFRLPRHLPCQPPLLRPPFSGLPRQPQAPALQSELSPPLRPEAGPPHLQQGVVGVRTMGGSPFLGSQERTHSKSREEELAAGHALVYSSIIHGFINHSSPRPSIIHLLIYSSSLFVPLSLLWRPQLRVLSGFDLSRLCGSCTAEAF